MRSLIIAAALACALTAAAQSAKYIDPMLGVDGGGNVTPGPSLPFGAVKPGPDMGSNGANAGWSRNNINGFSQTHVSGTGGGPKYGNILVQPTVGEIALENASPREDERAAVGYYAVGLQRFGTRAEITAARHVAVYRFTFPQSDKANIVIDAGHILTRRPVNRESQVLKASEVHILSPMSIAGSSTITGGWNRQPGTYTVYFYAELSHPAESSGTWRDGKLSPGSKDQASMPDSATGAWFTYSTQASEPITMKIGISFVSVDHARRFVAAETPGFNFDSVRHAAEAEWDHALAPLQITRASTEELVKFSTAMYHTLLMPVDRTGDNPLWQGSSPYYDDFYTIWDTFRTSNPLITLIDQKREVDIVRSLIDIQQHEGWLPDGRSGNFTGVTQGGSNADMVLADAFAKHLPGIDYEAAYKAMVKDAEEEPRNYLYAGRGDLDDWKNLGYISIEGSHSDRPASRHMEYAANDYAIALMAHGLGKKEDEKKYLVRAEQWKNLWDPEAKDGDVQGFIWPRHKDGTWKANFDPRLNGTWGEDNYYEGNPWTYSLYVPQDVAALIKQSGGREAFLHRLDEFFKGNQANNRGNRFDVGNEPGFLAPYLYNYAGQQSSTAMRVRTILEQSYTTGLPGNDDSGAMSSLYIFGKIGFMPVAAQDIYLIGSPYFPRTTMHLANGKTFTILADGVSDTNIYVGGAAWDGVPYRKSWFTHEQLMRGGTLRLRMISKPYHWDTGAPPPSMSGK